jgi:hypothetical protein
MFRRLATVAPRSVGTVVSPRITPAISGIQAQPITRASPAPQRRSYHEKVLDHYNNPRNGMFAILICCFLFLFSLEASMGAR